MSQNESSWSKLLVRFEAATRQGQGHRVIPELRSLVVAKIPRPFRARFAEIARRVSEPLLALKILNPLIYPKRSNMEPATAREKVIYASTLPGLGLTEEALRILSSIDSEDEPDVLLYSSFAHFGEWNYRKAVPLLKKYLSLGNKSSEKISEYMRLVGNVNLIAAYVGSYELDRALELIRITRSQAEKGEHWLLFGNILELEAQVYIKEKNYSRALEILTRAESVLRATGGLYYQLIKKWQLLCSLMMTPNSDDLIRQITQFQQQAAKERYWEIVRDCELYLGFASQDEGRVIHTVLGTPHAAFRHRAEQLWGRRLPLPNSYNRLLGTEPEIYDSHESKLLFHPTLSTTLQRLGKDFFKPLSLGTLFRNLYPGEVFDPFTSPKRVFNTIYRLSKWLAQEKWPLTIETNQLEFRLQGPCQLRLHRRRPQRELILLYSFRKKSKTATFNSRSLAQTLELSQRLAVQILKEGLKNHVLVKTGKGPATLYRFQNHLDKGSEK